jgi:MerR HTH family regulatory protein
MSLERAPDADSVNPDRAELRLVGPRELTTVEAATLLAVSPNVLRSWEREHGFPVPARTPGQRRLFNRSEVLLLREALASETSIPAATAKARTAAGRWRAHSVIVQRGL